MSSQRGTREHGQYVIGLQTVQAALVAPVTLAADTTASVTEFEIQIGQFVSLAHRAFRFLASGGATLLDESPDGGPVAQSGYEWRVYHAKGDTAYGAIVGPADQSNARFELPDVGSGSGRGRIYGGATAPSTSTVAAGGQTASQVGDWYVRKGNSGATNFYRCTVAGTPGTWVAVF